MKQPGVRRPTGALLRWAGARAGVRVGVLISIPWVLAVLATSLANPSRMLGALAGLPVLLVMGALTGWLWGPAARTRGRWRRRGLTLGVAVTATVLGALAVSSGMWLADAAEPWGRPPLRDLLALWAVGVAAFGLPSLLLTLPLAVSWRLDTLAWAHRRRAV